MVYLSPFLLFFTAILVLDNMIELQTIQPLPSPSNPEYYEGKQTIEETVEIEKLTVKGNEH